MLMSDGSVICLLYAHVIIVPHFIVNPTMLFSVCGADL